MKGVDGGCSGDLRGWVQNSLCLVCWDLIA